MKTAIEQFINRIEWIYKIHPAHYDIFSEYIKKEKKQMIDLIRFMRKNDKMGKTINDLYNEFYGNNVPSKICEYCGNEFFTRSSGMYKYQKYCSMDCREKEYYRRAKAKKEYNKFINQK